MEIRIPDLGDFGDVPVIEVHVTPGGTVAAEDPLITLESDKATMDIPAPAAGTVSELRVAVGDRVSAGDVIGQLQTGADTAPLAASVPASVPAGVSIAEDATEEPAEPAGYGSAAGVYETIEVAVPNLGDFADVPVIEVHVTPGDTVAAEDPLITLESDKATMDIPAPAAGTVGALRVAVGDRVSAGHVIADLRTGVTLV
ncbi:MAG: biotin/lipoyl-containing protein, partial [Streptosporangiaceae bacterium]